MRFLVYYSYTDLKGKERLRDNTRKDNSVTDVMNYFMTKMGDAGYINRSIDQVIEMTPKWRKKERVTNGHHDGESRARRGYSRYEKDFIFDHFSVEGPEYCAAELDLKLLSVKAYCARIRRTILENRLDLPIEAFMAPVQIAVGMGV